MAMVALPLELGLAVWAEQKIGLNLLMAIGARLLVLNVLQHRLFR